MKNGIIILKAQEISWRPGDARHNALARVRPARRRRKTTPDLRVKFWHMTLSAFIKYGSDRNFESGQRRQWCTVVNGNDPSGARICRDLVNRIFDGIGALGERGAYSPAHENCCSEERGKRISAHTPRNVAGWRHGHYRASAAVRVPTIRAQPLRRYRRCDTVIVVSPEAYFLLQSKLCRITLITRYQEGCLMFNRNRCHNAMVRGGFRTVASCFRCCFLHAASSKVLLFLTPATKANSRRHGTYALQTRINPSRPPRMRILQLRAAPKRDLLQNAKRPSAAAHYANFKNMTPYCCDGGGQRANVEKISAGLPISRTQFLTRQLLYFAQPKPQNALRRVLSSACVKTCTADIDRKALPATTVLRNAQLGLASCWKLDF
ncbi:hypothetical protein KCP73_01005 [Salmonella enterica subsp. enterica]|nr:hypothetical protein KCP73_01005 [Salmonella enterica subsp. enterica]